jgi:SAM-dependent methyltransferase
MKENLVINHYNDEYFSKYQKKIGEFGGKANVFKFKNYINESDTVLDFGCGGGYLLKQLKCNTKIGIELNPVARKTCIDQNKIDCFENIDEVQDESIDVIISNHCLEHTLSPYELINKMYTKLKKGGKIILVVPLDSLRYKWKPNDINNHLYSFSPMNMGNLLQGCNFKNINTDVILHKWPPFYIQIEKFFGSFIFNLSCLIYGRLNKKWVQVRGTAVK